MGSKPSDMVELKKGFGIDAVIVIKSLISKNLKEIKAPLHSLLGGFQPKPYHNYKCVEAFIKTY